MSLLDHGVVVEDFGGDIQSALISARSGSGVEELLEKILLQAKALKLMSKFLLIFWRFVRRILLAQLPHQRGHHLG